MTPPRPPLPDTFLGWHEAIRDAPEEERALLLRARGWWVVRVGVAQKGKHRAAPSIRREHSGARR